MGLRACVCVCVCVSCDMYMCTSMILLCWE